MMRSTTALRFVPIVLSALVFATPSPAAESDWPSHSVSARCVNVGSYGRYVAALLGAVDPVPGVGTSLIDVSNGGNVYSNPYESMSGYVYYRVWARRNDTWWWSPYKRVTATGQYTPAQTQGSDGGWYATRGFWNLFAPDDQANLALGAQEVAVQVPAGATYAVWVELYWDKPSFGYAYGGPLAGGWRHYDYLGTCSF